MKVNLHTFSGGSVIFDQCHMVWRAVAIKLQHMWTCLSHSWGDEGMTLLNSCQVINSLVCIEFFVANSIAQGKEGAHSQHHQKGMGGHQNPQGRPLPCGSNSGQESSPGSHG